MSLVLNTNEPGHGFRVSNDAIRDYPDFGQLLLYPKHGASVTLTASTSASTPTAENFDTQEDFSINGTKVNVVNELLDEEKMYTGTYSGSVLGTNSHFYFMCNGSWVASSGNIHKKTVISRLGFPQKLSAGLTIGKKIIYNPCLYIYGQNSFNRVTFTIGIIFRCGLLHSDGTITYGERMESDGLKIPITETSEKYFGTNTRFGIYEGSGVTTTEGDIFILELGVRQTLNPGGGSGTFTNSRGELHIYNGVMGTPSNYLLDKSYETWGTTNPQSLISGTNIRARPIQISIE